jgi:hypothetical protein
LHATSHGVGLGKDAEPWQKLVKATRTQGRDRLSADLFARHPDLGGLTVRDATACQADVSRAGTMADVSRKLRAVGADSGSVSGSFYRVPALLSCLTGHLAWLDEDGIPTLAQMLQVEEKPVRLRFVELLAPVQEPAATAALGERALYDLAAEVREAAVRALEFRPRAHVRPFFLRGLRHPWAPAADHAAEALVALDDEGAVPDLLALLDEPDPAGPTQDGAGNWAVPELVRVNHLAN